MTDDINVKVETPLVLEECDSCGDIPEYLHVDVCWDNGNKEWYLSTAWCTPCFKKEEQ